MRESGIEYDSLGAKHPKSASITPSLNTYPENNWEKAAQSENTTKLKARGSELATPYGPLLNMDSIRLLCIEPGVVGSALECSLETTRLSCPEYSFEAISYVWGDTSKLKHIKIVEGSIKVTRNLYAAILSLRLPYEQRYVWADASCINQEDAQERGHQAKLIRKIYKSAKKVLIWLGPTTKNKAFLAFSAICGIASGGYLNGTRVGQANFYTNGMSTANIPDVPCRDGPPPLNFKIFWTAVQDLFNQNWFWRVWAIQEVSLARETDIIWDNESIAWQHVGLAASRIRRNHHDVLQQYPMDGIFNAYFMYRLSHGTTNLPPLVISFPRLLSLTRHFESTDARDRVYRLLSIQTTDANPSKGDFFIQPDYEKSLQEVYTELAAKVISSENRLSLLSNVRHGEELSNDENWNGWPSWVPSWDKSIIHALSPTEPGPTAAPRVPGYEYTLHITPHNELVVSGHIYANIATVFNPFPAAQSSSSSSTSSAWPVPAYVPDTPAWTTHLSSSTGLATLAMTLTAGNSWYGQPVHNVAAHIADFAAYAMHVGLATSTSTAAAAAAATATSGAAEVNWQRFALAARHACSGRRPFSLTPVTMMMMEDDDDDNVGMDPFWGHGIGPAAMAPGDLLCVLFGFDLPVVLRLVEGSRYRFIGECYVHDLMDGRAVRNPDRRQETFVLI
jgi:hypothetical protein